MIGRHVLIVIAIAFTQSAAAFETTAKGKIQTTQGHVAPNCRIISHRENGTGTTRTFRIQDVQGHDDVNAVALSALLANRDTTISYDSSVTSGCGSEPRVMFITVY